jgi:outer membrane protein OmpA-like peptidoglycan-associated protein
VYSYYSGSDIFGTASYLSGYANPNLRWQVVKKGSLGIDAGFLNNRLTTTLDVYQTKTDPMVVQIDQKYSSGITKYPVNMGFVKTQGLEFTVGYYIIRDVAKRISLNVRLTGNTFRSEYGGFSEALENLNNEFKSDENYSDASLNPNSLVRYQDGSSPTALWAVRSLGIDPATGREVFLTKEGVPTSAYNIDDRVKIADTNPDIKGVFGISFRYKKIIGSFNFRYSLGGYKFNSALFNKVENISYTNIVYNQDKRALYDRWQNPGDVTQFKGITENLVVPSTTQMSSRFIQRDNYFTGESGKISWDFSDDKWVRTIGARDFKLSISMSDLFRLSTIREERGIDYPFERSISLGVSASFNGGGSPVQSAPVASDKTINEGVNQYREELAQAQSELNEMKQALALCKQQEKPKEVSVSVKEIQKEVVVSTPTAVFFNIGSAELDDKGKANIKLIAKALKENAGKKFKVTGYADSATGTPQLNKELSEARAKAVYNALIAEGVSKDTIQCSGVGDTESVFEKSNLNRAVIMEYINK